MLTRRRQGRRKRVDHASHRIARDAAQVSKISRRASNDCGHGPSRVSMILTSETRAAFVAPRWLAQHIGTGGRLEGRASAASLQADCDRSITVIAPRIMVRHGRLRSRRTEACDPCSERPRQLKSFSGLVLPSQRRPIGLRLQICYSSVRFRPAPLDTGELVGWIVGFVGTASGSSCSRGRSRTVASPSSCGGRVAVE